MVRATVALAPGAGDVMTMPLWTDSTSPCPTAFTLRVDQSRRVCDAAADGLQRDIHSGNAVLSATDELPVHRVILVAGQHWCCRATYILQYARRWYRVHY